MKATRLRRAATGPRAALAVLACAFAVLSPALAAPAQAGEHASSAAALPQADVSHGTPSSDKGEATATLEQCATASAPQSERAATFAGEMTATSASTRMQLRIALQERAPGAMHYRTVTAPNLGVWQSSDAGVKVFTHIEQVTDLSAPADYRGAIEFRWLDARGHVLKFEELHTAGCVQPPPSTPAPATPTSSS